MITRRLCIVFLIGFVTLLVTPTIQYSHATIAPTVRADGGRPVPPYPPPPGLALQTTQAASMLLADGGRPVPPYPPPSGPAQPATV